MLIHELVRLFSASTLSDKTSRTRSGPRKRRFMEKDEDVDYSNLLGYQVVFMYIRRIKPGFHYPSSKPEFTGRQLRQ